MLSNAVDGDDAVDDANAVDGDESDAGLIRFPPCRSRADPTVPDIGFGTEEMEVFLSFHIPRTLLLILAIMNKQVEYSNACVLDCVEFFRGQGNCTSAILARVLRAIPYDVLNCPG